MTTRENAQQFIQRLVDDKEFRAEAERDPVAAAAHYGFRIDPASLPKGGIVLPPPDVLSKNADAMASRLHDDCNVIIHFIL